MSESVVSAQSVFDFSARRLGGAEETMEKYRGQALLIVNTASKCGFTGQYSGLESLYQEFKGEGFSVLGFPCNQFGAQEPGSDDEIQSFCQINYGVTFPIFEKIDVNGDNAHPLFVHLKSQAKGVMGTKGIKWNFTKFLVGRDGTVLHRYGPQSKPESLREAIQQVL